ncbi:MAG: IS110 family transposase [Bacteroidota bacterium]
MIHPKMKHVYVGVDSHKETHCAVILNCFYEKLGEITFQNAPGAFPEFISSIQKFKPKGTSFIFGLEDISAYGRSLTVFLTKRKYQVKHVNAALVASERKSQNILHKTDQVDAECAARVLLNRFDQLPNADPQDKFWVLANLVARRRSIMKMNIMLKNHLHSFLIGHYPSYGKFFTNTCCNTGLVFFEKYPSPAKLQDVTAPELAELLEETSCKFFGLAKARQILDCIKRDGDTGTEYQEARDMAIKSTINQINNNLKELESIDTILEEFIDKFDYKLTSMRGIDTVTAAYLIAEIGDIKRFATPAKLARYCGVAPVTYSSGQTNIQYANQRGNRTLNSIFYHLAVIVTMTNGKNNKMNNPFFYEYYHKKLQEGKTKGQALKCVQRRLVNIIWRLMYYNQEYINPPMLDVPKPQKEPKETTS